MRKTYSETSHEQNGWHIKKLNVLMSSTYLQGFGEVHHTALGCSISSKTVNRSQATVRLDVANRCNLLQEWLKENGLSLLQEMEEHGYCHIYVSLHKYLRLQQRSNNRKHGETRSVQLVKQWKVDLKKRLKEVKLHRHKTPNRSVLI